VNQSKPKFGPDRYIFEQLQHNSQWWDPDGTDRPKNII